MVSPGLLSGLPGSTGDQHGFGLFLILPFFFWAVLVSEGSSQVLRRSHAGAARKVRQKALGTVPHHLAFRIQPQRDSYKQQRTRPHVSF